jgi:hypothetical protein
MITNADLDKSSLESARSSLPSVDLKTILRKRNILVLRLLSVEFVSRYSQDLIAKNIAPISSHDTAFSQSVDAKFCNFRSTNIGRAFCFFLLLSWFLYALHCSVNRKQVLPSWSNLGSGRSFALKA